MLDPSNVIVAIPSFLALVCGVRWAQVDARSRGSWLSWGQAIVVFIAPALALPAYLIWTRGWRGLISSTVFFFLLALIFTVGYELRVWAWYR